MKKVNFIKTAAIIAVFSFSFLGLNFAGSAGKAYAAATYISSCRIRLSGTVRYNIRARLTNMTSSTKIMGIKANGVSAIRYVQPYQTTTVTIYPAASFSTPTYVRNSDTGLSGWLYFRTVGNTPNC